MFVPRPLRFDEGRDDCEITRSVKSIYALRVNTLKLVADSELVEGLRRYL